MDERKTSQSGKGKGKPDGGVATVEASPSAPLTGAPAARAVVRQDHIFEIRDAEKVLAAAEAHRLLIEKKGVKESKFTRFRAQIAEAKAVENLGGRVSLDEARATLKDRLGEYRDAADLAATPFEGRDKQLAATLKVDGAFPADDAALARYATEVAAPMAAHSALLVEFDLSVEQQNSLTAATVAFLEALARRPDQTAELRKQSADRGRVLTNLRNMTISVRLAGRKALKTSSHRSDFDRADPTSAETSARAAAEAQKAQKQQQRLDAEAAEAKVDAEAKSKRAEDLKAKEAEKKQKGKKKR